MVQITTSIYAIGYVDVRRATELAIEEGRKFCTVNCAFRHWS